MIDVLIVGAGGAGLSAALSAAKKGAKVAVICEGYPTRSQTCMAQGGINAVIEESLQDTIAKHIEDTLASSGKLGSKKMITSLCEDAPKTIAWLESIGMPFSRTEAGKVAQRRLGGARGERACYAQDFTGLKILHTLYDQCLKAGIEFYHERFLLNFAVEENIVKGLSCLDIRSTNVEFYEAKSVIVATGGFSALYFGFTTNAVGSTGDGIAAALRAGAGLGNMEFVQFHPTGLKNSGILISESARGAGGYLVNQKGERFVDELKPRDEVSRAIYAQIEAGNEAFLDIRHLGEAFIDAQIPQERKLALMYEGIDPVSALIPIAPVAHYSMGGITVDARHQSSVEGLFAVGECANASVHGANRLGGNSLLEIVSFGRAAGENAAEFATNNAYHAPSNRQFESDKQFIADVYDFTGRIDFYEKRAFLGEIFYRNVGIFREDTALKAVLSQLEHIQRELPFMGLGDRSTTYNTNLVEFIKFGNILELGEVVLVSAIARMESRGAHFRRDYPTVHERFEKESVSWKEDGALCVDFKKVVS